MVVRDNSLLNEYWVAGLTMFAAATGRFDSAYKSHHYGIRIQHIADRDLYKAYNERLDPALQCMAVLQAQ